MSERIRFLTGSFVRLFYFFRHARGLTNLTVFTILQFLTVFLQTKYVGR